MPPVNSSRCLLGPPPPPSSDVFAGRVRNRRRSLSWLWIRSWEGPGRRPCPARQVVRLELTQNLAQQLEQVLRPSGSPRFSADTAAWVFTSAEDSSACSAATSTSLIAELAACQVLRLGLDRVGAEVEPRLQSTDRGASGRQRWLDRGVERGQRRRWHWPGCRPSAQRRRTASTDLRSRQRDGDGV